MSRTDASCTPGPGVPLLHSKTVPVADGERFPTRIALMRPLAGRFALHLRDATRLPTMWASRSQRPKPRFSVRVRPASTKWPHFLSTFSPLAAGMGGKLPMRVHTRLALRSALRRVNSNSGGSRMRLSVDHGRAKPICGRSSLVVSHDPLNLYSRALPPVIR